MLANHSFQGLTLTDNDLAEPQEGSFEVLFPDEDEQPQPTCELTSGIERRRAFRLYKSIPAEVEVLDAAGTPQGDEHRWRVRILDISASGFRAFHGRSLSAGDRLQALIHLTEVEPVVVTCHVVWTRGAADLASYEFGCEFDDVSETAWKRLVDFIVFESRQGE
jgi:c-di-GMP-binding flagellar brake protein YcgR